MSITLAQILNDALTLGEEERIELVEALMSTKWPGVDRPIVEDLVELSRRGCEEFDAGGLALLPWDEVRRRAREGIGE